VWLRAVQAPGAEATLSSDLRRALATILLLVFAACAVTLVGIVNLNRQIAGWSEIEALDTAREGLVRAVHNNVDLPSADHSALLVEAFGDLARQIQQLTDAGHRDQMVEDAAQSLGRGYRLFIEAQNLHAQVEVDHEDLQDRASQLLSASAGWAASLRLYDQLAQADAALSETKHRKSYAEVTVLSTALLATERVQRKLEAALRLADTSRSLLLASAIAAIGEPGLPGRCGAPGAGDATAPCSPSFERARAALEALGAASESEAEAAIGEALLSLEAYSRAAQSRFETAATELGSAIDLGGQARERLAAAAVRDVALSRVNRVFLQVQTALDQSLEGGPGLVEVEKTMSFLISQMRYRGAGLLRQAPELGGDPAELATLVAGFADRWAEATETIRARDLLRSDFDREMETLAAAISANALDVRSATTLWVSIFTLAVVGACAGFAILVMAILWLAERRFILPLTRVTRTILDLARGNLAQVERVEHRAFGFDRLGRAIEQLRLAMIERDAFAERNAQQKSEIEGNLRALEQTTTRMQWLALHDPLTELANRRHADADLAVLTEEGAASGQDFCLVHLDVDRFKEVNDALGHEAGDHVLRHVAALLRGTVPPGARCYRIGGDEFLIALTGHVDDAGAGDLAGRICAEMARPIDFSGHAIRSGASLGIAYGRDAGFDAAATLVNADLALYETKRNGRNGFRYFSAALQSASIERKALSDLLLAAIEGEEFIPYYQPQFYARDLSLRGLETLCRWHVPGRGWIPPGQFLTVAEDLKLVGKIDQILFRKASRDIRTLRGLGLAVPKISFNLSADRLTNMNLASDLADTLGSEVQIAVELLESMSLDSLSETVRWSIDSLKERGIEIEIDDFGSCRASVAGLIAVGPDAMKIDSSLILPLTHSTQHLDLVKALVEIGRALDIEVVGEGVETWEHVDLLAQLGCDVLQGFALARPMPLEALVALLRDASAMPGARRAG
jgi:diguanylate cyclase (GGDEF)-like protein